MLNANIYCHFNIYKHDNYIIWEFEREEKYIGHDVLTYLSNHIQPRLAKALLSYVHSWVQHDSYCFCLSVCKQKNGSKYQQVEHFFLHTGYRYLRFYPGIDRTHAILPRLSHEDYINCLYWNSRTLSSSDVIIMVKWCHYVKLYLSVFRDFWKVIFK